MFRSGFIDERRSCAAREVSISSAWPVSYNSVKKTVTASQEYRPHAEYEPQRADPSSLLLAK
jgi:hypothetical protein